MKLLIYIFAAMFFTMFAKFANAQQNVGIGTTTPNDKSILELSSTTQGFLPPVMNNQQMNAIASPPPGLMIYNSENQSPMVYAQKGWVYDIPSQNYLATFDWVPVSVGPRMLAWGKVDSTNINAPFTDTQSGVVTTHGSSENFSVSWDGMNRWFELSLNNIEYSADSMLLIITPTGNGSWYQIVSTGILIKPTGNTAAIKMGDAYRLANGVDLFGSRRRSNFHFVLYSMKKDPL